MPNNDETEGKEPYSSPTNILLVTPPIHHPTNSEESTPEDEEVNVRSKGGLLSPPAASPKPKIAVVEHSSALESKEDLARKRPLPERDKQL